MFEIKKPLVSMIITCHNLGSYLLECVKSIENQTYKNYEIIIVDDGSDETTKAVIEKHFKNKGVFAKFFNSSEIRVIEIAKNEGQLGAFLQGLKVARGEFVCMIDADDILFEDYLQVHLQVHMRTNVAFTSAGQAEIDSRGVVHSLYSISNPIFKNKDETLQKLPVEKVFTVDTTNFEVKIFDKKHFAMGQWGWASSTSAMMRKSALELMLLYKDPGHYKTGADKFIFSFLQLIGSSAVIDAPLYAYRRHKDKPAKSNPIMGDCEYLQYLQLKKKIEKTKVIRWDVLKFLCNNYSYFCKRLNSLNVKKLILTVIFSINRHTIKQALEALVFKLSKP